MRIAGVLLVAGIVITAMGAALMFLAEDIKLNKEDTVTVPAGADNFAWLEVDMGTGGPIEGSFRSINGSWVMLSVMDGYQFATFVVGLGDDARTEVTGESGEFSVEQVDMEACYIVVRHSPGVESEQPVEVEYTVLNANWNYFLATGLYVSGGIAVFLAFYTRQKANEKNRTFVRKYTDVVFFEE